MAAFDLPGQNAVTMSEVTGEIRRAERAAGRLNPVGPRPVLHVAARRTGWKYDWALLDHAVSPHRTITHGRAWTRAGGQRLAYRAHKADLAARAIEASGLRDRRQDGLGCE